MTIRILCIVIAFIVAVWVNREVNLSGGWTVIFTLLASAAVGFMAIIIPLNYEGYVTPVRTGYRPDCYVSVYNGESDSQYQILTMEHYLRVRKLP